MDQFELSNINGPNDLFVFRISEKVLAAYSGIKGEFSDKVYRQFTFNQVKNVIDSEEVNNTYHFNMKSSQMQGVSFGSSTCSGRIVFRDGKVSAIETIKKFLFTEFQKLEPNTGAENEDIEEGFLTKNVTGELSTTKLSKTYESSSFYKINEAELPAFDLINLTTNSSGSGIIAKKEFIGIKFIGNGSADSATSVEANSMASVLISKINDTHTFTGVNTVGVNK